MVADSLHSLLEFCPAMIFIADAEGLLHARSRALDERFGHRLIDAASLAALVDPRDQATLAALLRTPADQRTAAAQLRVPLADGGSALVDCTLRRADDGSLHGQLALAPDSHGERIERIEHALLHALMNTLDIALWAITPDGTFVFHDGKAIESAGIQRGQLIGLNIFDLYSNEGAVAIREALRGKPSYNAAKLHEHHWDTWYVPLTNDAGAVDYCAGVTLDVTERVETAQRLARQLDTISAQQRAIHELSAPVLNLWDRVLAVPLIGIMDAQRTDELTDRLLAEVHRGKTRFAILDLTGVEAVDTSIAGHVLRLIATLRLLGVEGLVTGVSPQVAQTMVGVGIEFEHVTTHRTLREGLRHCMHALSGARSANEPLAPSPA
jgi:rsbT co-antagonist protein RsbR